MPTSQGAIRLFRYAGIDVFLHWSWFVVALYQIQRPSAYRSPVWKVAEYLALFAIVTLHEFGHSLACRQVGGNAERIVLWPLGGVAYVDPPQRPGATLWSIAAGPLVNVVLVPVLFGLMLIGGSAGLAETSPDASAWLGMVFTINVVLLVFNLLPVYPLDGGQILRSLLWFVLGRARSLTAASVVAVDALTGPTSVRETTTVLPAIRPRQKVHAAICSCSRPSSAASRGCSSESTAPWTTMSAAG